MSELPYFNPDDDLSLNVGLLMIIIEKLSATPRGRLLLNNERLRAYLYLIKNPLILNRVLNVFGCSVAQLEDYDEYSIVSIAANTDPFHNDRWLRRFLMILAGYGFIDVNYKKTEGFLYRLSDKGREVERRMVGDYFSAVRNYVGAMASLSSISTSNLNAVIEMSGKYE